MTYDPAMGSGRFARWDTNMSSPERELRKVLEALRDSAEGLHQAADIVDDNAASSVLEDMSNMRETAVETVITLSADAGVVIDADVDGGLEGKLRRGWMRLEEVMAGDDAVIDTVISQEDRLLGTLDSALGTDLPQMVKDQLRLADAQVRDGVRILSNRA